MWIISYTGTGQWPLSMTNLSPSKRGCRSPSFHKIKVQADDVGLAGRWKLLSFTSGIPEPVAGLTSHIESEARKLCWCFQFIIPSWTTPTSLVWLQQKSKYNGLLKLLLRTLHWVPSRFECAMKAAMKKLNCVPWYLPQKNGTKPCRCESIHISPWTGMP